MEEGEGISQRTWMKDPWTWRMVWGLTTEVRDGLGGGGQRGKTGTSVNSINNIFFKNIKNENFLKKFRCE